MKNKDFKPITIGYDERAKNQFDANLTALRSHLTDFFKECTKYVEIKDKNAYKGDLLNSFISDFSGKYSSQFSELLTIEKILELSDVDTHKLRFLESRIKEININIDYNTLESVTPDFSIKTNSLEENLLYEYANGISKAIYDNKPNHLTFFNADLQRAFCGLLLYDFSNQKLVPNISWIKGNYRRV